MRRVCGLAFVAAMLGAGCCPRTEPMATGGSGSAGGECPSTVPLNHRPLAVNATAAMTVRCPVRMVATAASRTPTAARLMPASTCAAVHPRHGSTPGPASTGASSAIARSDTDCACGFCSPSYDSNCGAFFGYQGYYCHGPRDSLHQRRRLRRRLLRLHSPGRALGLRLRLLCRLESQATAGSSVGFWWPPFPLPSRADGPRLASGPTARTCTIGQFRRAELLASLVNPGNDYSRERIDKYAVDGGLDSLPEWNPPVQVLGTSATIRQRCSLVRRHRPGPGRLCALGERAFYRYPAQLTGLTERVLARGCANPTDYGFWRDSEAGIGGLVTVTLPSGRTGLAFTCASCHAAVRDGRLVTGLGNELLDLGRIATDDAAARPSFREGQGGRRLGPRPPGRKHHTGHRAGSDSRTCAPRDFNRICRPDATVAQRDLVSLAIRLETLIITSNEEVVRPPREVTLALAAYVWSLGESLPPIDASQHAAGARRLRACLRRMPRPPDYSGPPVPLEVVGTRPNGWSIARPRNRILPRCLRCGVSRFAGACCTMEPSVVGRAAGLGPRERPPRPSFRLAIA